MTNNKAMLSYLISQNLCHISLYTKLDKPIIAVINQIPITIPAQDICKALQGLGFDIISIRQMSAKCPSRGGPLTSVKSNTNGLRLA
jgi:hypothetical protein